MRKKFFFVMFLHDLFSYNDKKMCFFFHSGFSRIVSFEFRKNNFWNSSFQTNKPLHLTELSNNVCLVPLERFNLFVENDYHKLLNVTFSPTYCIFITQSLVTVRYANTSPLLSSFNSACFIVKKKKNLRYFIFLKTLFHTRLG